jgi:hypothetical protein
MDEFPVNNGAQRLWADDQVAEPQVAVHGHRPAGRWRAGLERGQRELEDRAALLECRECRTQVRDRIRRGQAGGRVERMQARGERAELTGKHLPRLPVGVVPQDAAGDGLAGDAAHHQARRPPQAGLVGADQYLGHGQPGGPGRADGAGFAAHGTRFARPAWRVAAEHQPSARSVTADGVKSPGLAGCAARQRGHPLDGDLAETLPQGRGEPGRLHQPSLTPLGARWCI